MSKFEAIAPRRGFFVAVPLLLGACTSLPRMPDPPPTHPASPQAAEAPLPERPWLLDPKAEDKPTEEPKKEEPKKQQPHQHGQGHEGTK